MTEFQTVRLSPDADATAPDGAEVRLLPQTSRGSMAHFSLSPSRVSKAVVHKTVEEIWYFVGGRGRMWRKDDEREEVVEVAPGIGISIPTGTQFQFRTDSDEPLTAVAVTMPPWSGEDEVEFVAGPWDAE